MKKYIIILLFALTLSVNLASAEANSHKIIKVIDGDTVYIDFNDNGIPEQDEKVRINGICKKTHDLISLDRWFDYFGAKNCTLLTLLIAESKPEEMEIMKQIVVSVLNKGENYAIY